MGGIYNNAVNGMVLNENFITANTAERGGGIYNRNSRSIVVRNCRIRGNTVDHQGGGLYNSASDLILVNGSISSNTANFGGGMYNTANSNVLVSNCLLTKNAAYKEGGGLFNSAGTMLKMWNSYLFDNSAEKGGAAYNNSTFFDIIDVAIFNSTFLENSATLGSGGIHNKSNASPRLRNCILWNNRSDALLGEIYNEEADSVPDVQYSCVRGGYPGEGNISQDPLFLGDLSAGLYLRPGSPCIDAGDNSAIPPDSTDLDENGNRLEPTPVDLLHNARTFDIPEIADSGNGLAPLVDMGAIEVTGQPVIMASDISISESDGLVRVPVSGFWTENDSIRIEYTVADNTARNELDYIASSGSLLWSAGTQATQFIPVTILEDAEREKNETLTINLVDASGTALLLNRSVTITIVSRDVLHVKFDAVEEGDGTSWTDAFTNLQDALKVANSGDDIWVAAGTYVPGMSRQATFQLTDGISVYGGFTGNETSIDQRDPSTNVTILSGDINGDDGNNFANNADNVYHVVTLNGQCRLEGFTITAGNANINNDLGSLGGGVLSIGSQATVNQCTFIGNTAEDGGAVYSQFSDLNLSNCLLIENSAIGNHGGAIYSKYSNLTLSNSSITGGVADIGGAISIHETRAFLDGISISDSTAWAGGGIYCERSTIKVLESSIFANRATRDGGGIYGEESELSLISCTFRNNFASDGGGIFTDHSTTDVKDCVFTKNKAEFGGGMYSDEGTVTIAHTSLFENEAKGGGGVYIDGTAVSMVDSSFKNNLAAEGGGILNDFGTTSLINIEIIDNSASVNGGGLFNEDAELSMINCLILRNNALAGGALFTSNSELTLTNCTLTENSADNLGGGLYNQDATSLTLKNCILWENSARDSSQSELFVDGTSTSEVHYSCVQGGHPGTGNIDQNPLFANGLGGVVYLAPGSPCIDAGDNISVPKDELDIDGDDDMNEAIPVDILGNARLMDIPHVVDTGNGSFPLVDMGAYEVTGQTALFVADVEINESMTTANVPVEVIWPGSTPVSVEYTVTDGTAEADLDYSATSGTLNWTVGADSVQTIPISVLDDFEIEVNETVFITLSNASPNAINLNSLAKLTIQSPEVIYVNASASGQNTGSGWANAFIDLQKALAIADNGDEIWVVAGKYIPGIERTSSFKLPHGVKLYGGFAGGELSVDDRNWVANEVILSGDLRTNDSDEDLSLRDNAYHVLTINGIVSSMASSLKGEMQMETTSMKYTAVVY